MGADPAADRAALACQSRASRRECRQHRVACYRQGIGKFGQPAAGFRDADAAAGEPSEAIRGRVLSSRTIQRQRFGAVAAKVNAAMEGALLREHCPLDARSMTLLDAAVRKFCLSARGYDRVLRVSRTIADLAASPRIATGHVAEALQYRIRHG